MPPPAVTEQESPQWAAVLAQKITKCYPACMHLILGDGLLSEAKPANTVISPLDVFLIIMMRKSYNYSPAL